jgi:hypothetical protein
MAPSQPSNPCALGLPSWALLAALAMALALVHTASAAATGPVNKCTEATDVKAESFDADYKSNTTQLRNVVISQCDIRVEAKHASATGLNFDNTRWTFDGDVRVNVENRGRQPRRIRAASGRGVDDRSRSRGRNCL